MAAAASLAALLAGPGRPAQAGAEGVPTCSAGGAPVVFTGAVVPEDAKTYRNLPFDVAAGTTRVEVGYAWEDNAPVPAAPGVGGLVQTVFDLGLWDEGGIGTVAGFRGWSGSRQGRTAEGQAPVWVQADSAERGYRPDPVLPGTWNVDLGVAAVAPGGAAYTVTVRCLATAVGPPFRDHPVDAGHVADPGAGWYMGDLHVHAFHSHPRGPSPDAMVRYAREAGLDFVPVTEYVTNQHWRELGPAQEANRDLVLWPAREIITYFGHAIALGETPNVIDWRHGAPGVSLRGIQAVTVADGALFGVAHPTSFPTAVFASFCRGCEFTLGDVIDWDRVSTIEVLNGPVLFDDTVAGGPGLGVRLENPFVLTSLDLWQQLLRRGHKITAVSGSDDKLGPDYGSSVTAVHARELSRDALAEGLRAGHAYIRTRGAHLSPTVEVEARAPDGERGIVGDTLRTDVAELEVRVRGAAGQELIVTKDGRPADLRVIDGNDFRTTIAATRDRASGPLGTFWRVDTRDAQAYTTIGNPVFLAPPGPSAPVAPSPSQPAGPAPARDRLPATGAMPLAPAAASLVVAALAATMWRRVWRTGAGTGR